LTPEHCSFDREHCSAPGRLPAGKARRGPGSWLQAKDWDMHVTDLEQIAESVGFRDLRERVLGLAHLRSTDRVLDVGAGTGLLALAAAPHAASVHALDVSPAMCSHLAGKFHQSGISNARVLLGNATDIPLADGAVDVVISNYCFHHLPDGEKGRALAQVMRVLRPGGRLVFADMMFRIAGASRRDLALSARFARQMIRHGPAGVVRLLKNVIRVLSGCGDQPADVDWWRETLLREGFVDVSVASLAHEGGIACARKPASPALSTVRVKSGE
jgi:ubiquinone/menaquinone biosynthesis C-methylase UbiE